MRRFRWKKRLRSADIVTGAVPGLISVVLPVYNGAAYLGEAIDSILAQTETNWELWVVDDGSVDDSGRIADRYAAQDRRIRVIHQSNQKLPAALNCGFTAARGEFYTWISADNRMLPTCLAALSDALRRHPSRDMVFGNEYLIDQNGARITGHGWFEVPPGSGRVCFPPATPLLNTVANNTIGAAFLYRAGVDAVLGGYATALYLLEDYDYFMRINSLFRIGHIKTAVPIYEYRFHPDSLTAHDAALGITAARPRLMQFDALRRSALLRRIPVTLRSFDSAQKRTLFRCGLCEGDGASVCFVTGDSPDPSFLYTIAQAESGYKVFYEGRLLASLSAFGKTADFLFLHLHCCEFRQKESAFFAR